MSNPEQPIYRGRLAPSPTGLLHLGHACTFWTAHERAQAANGTLVLRNEDIDAQRGKPEFVDAFIEDLKWLGCKWQEGPDIGGAFAPYNQSERLSDYRRNLVRLIETGHVYACTCSRKDIQSAPGAPHGADDEVLYLGRCRSNKCVGAAVEAAKLNPGAWGLTNASRFSLRFNAPNEQVVRFHDENLGRQSFVAGQDFGDFILWRHDDVPSYQIAVVSDDLAMNVTEVVRGEDLLVSTARQILTYQALDALPPSFFHCPLVRDKKGERLSKRFDSLSLRALRISGKSPEQVRAMWEI